MEQEDPIGKISEGKKIVQDPVSKLETDSILQ